MTMLDDNPALDGHAVDGRAIGELTGVPAQPVPTASDDPRDPLHRVHLLLDAGTAELIRAVDGSGALAARGRVRGVPVVTFVSDPRVQGGAMGAEGCEAMVCAYEAAMAARVPIIGIWHSGGARLREGAASLHGVGQVFAAMTRASGRIPQISVVLGAAAGGAAYGPALTDIVVLSEQGQVFVTGPSVIRSVTGEDVDMAGLGGTEPHSTKSGVVHLTAPDDATAIGLGADLAVLLGAQGTFDPASVADADLGEILPESPRRAYDVHPLVNGLLDGPGLELHPRWGRNIVTTLGRFGGRTVGVIANNPLRLAGCLDSVSAEKAARFVRMCDAFGVPMLVAVDVPGYLPGVGQEHGGVVRRGAKLLHAFAEARVPRITLITRKAIGGAYIAMNSRSLGATTVLAWPTAQVAVMGSVAAVRVLKRRQLAEVPDEHKADAEARLAAEHERETGGLSRAIEIGAIDEVIDPSRTRTAIAAALAAAPPTRGAHGNIPL